MRARNVDELAVACRAVLVVHPSRMPVDVPEEGLLALVDHLDGPVGVEGEHAGVRLHREVLAAAEGAPTPAGVSRTLSGSSPRLEAIWLRSTCSHCVAT